MSAMENAPATILIVDDDPSVRETLQLAFAAEGYVASAVSTSMACLALLDAGAKFDLLVIDVLMPPSIPNGFSLGRVVRYRKPKQRLVFMSGAIESLPKRELDGAQAPVLAKPVRIAELLAAVRMVLAAA
jgi:DNA-binding response OmpR family regulator